MQTEQLERITRAMEEDAKAQREALETRLKAVLDRFVALALLVTLRMSLRCASTLCWPGEGGNYRRWPGEVASHNHAVLAQ